MSPARLPGVGVSVRVPRTRQRAGPAVVAIFDESLPIAQVDDERVELIVFGDRYHAPYGTADGHTVISDSDVGGSYACWPPRGSSCRGGPVDNPPLGLQTQAKESAEGRNARFLRRY